MGLVESVSQAVEKKLTGMSNVLWAVVQSVTFLIE